MKKNEFVILFIYLSLVVPGPNLIYANKFTISFLPLLCLSSIIYLTKREWLRYDFNLIKSRGLYYWIYKGSQYCIYSHAIGVLIFGYSPTTPEILIYKFPIISLYTVLTGPVIEEVVFRKIIFKYFNHRYSFIVSASLSSILFAIGHFDINRLVTYFLVGISLCYIYWKSKNLLVSIFTHFVLNIIAIIVSTLKI